MLRDSDRGSRQRSRLGHVRSSLAATITTAALLGATSAEAAISPKTKRVSVSSAGAQANSFSEMPAISADGRFVAFHSLVSNLVANDTNVADVFRRNLKTGRTKRVSVSSSGAEGNSFSHFPSISADGRFVSFNSSASNLVANDTNGYGDVFVRNLKTGSTNRVSVSSSGAEGNSGSAEHSISADGRFVAFMSSASNLVANDSNPAPDIFRRGPLR